MSKDVLGAIKEMKEKINLDLSNDQIKNNLGVNLIASNLKIVTDAANAGAALTDTALTGDAEKQSASAFVGKLIKAMIPSPELVGNALSAVLLKDSKVDTFTSQEEFERALLSDRVANAKATGKRSSTTAIKCKKEGCNSYHFLPTGFCAVHSSQKEVSSVFKSSESESTRLEDFRPDLIQADHFTVLSQLRSEMLSIAQSFDTKSSAFASLQTEAASLLKGIQMDNVEKAQLLGQFKTLDVNKNGTIDAADVVYLISLIDEEFLKDLSNLEKEAQVVNWIKEINGSQPVMTFQQYVTALQAYRASCDAEDAIVELNRYAFWDLRGVILSCPTTTKSGWLLKRGYFFSKEDMNPWSFRYFAVDGSKLTYYTTIPGTSTSYDGKEIEHKILKTVNLLECAIADFSPKTIAPEFQTTNFDEPTVFKITLYSGKRLTLATSRRDAVEWVAYLYWFANSSKLALQWRMNFGAIRKTSITIRDYIMLGSVVAKVLRGAEVLKKDPKAKDTPKFQKEFGLNDGDEYYIKLFGFTKETVTEAQGMIIHAVTGLKMFKGVVSKTDDWLAFGIGKKVVNSIILTTNTYLFAAAAKNQFNQNKYGVIWQSKAKISDCPICKLHFKSFSFRQTTSKHHCRCCGRVVCYFCAPEKVELAKTGKYERICVECISAGGVPPNHCLAKNESSGLTNLLAKSAAAGTAAAAEDEDDNEDLEESDGEDD